MFGGNYLPECLDPGTSHEIMPWQEQQRLLGKEEVVDTNVLQDQPAIDEGILIIANVEETNNRGGISIRITPDGKVKGVWKSDYNKGRNPRMNYVMDAMFTGNIDPTNVFFDENGEDMTKLFVIAKGEVMIVAMGYKDGSIRKNFQEIWITGWVNPDQTAKGEVVMLTGGDTFQTFHWESSYNSRKRKGLF